MEPDLIADCSAGTYAFDPDIAGLGVVLSFIIASVSNILLVVAAYTKDSLPGLELTEVDKVITGTLADLVRCKARRKALVDSTKPSKRYSIWFERVLLALADQQLVTGLAIVIAAFSRWRNISLYSLNVVWNMASCSFVTHLGTLRFVPTCLNRHPVLRTARVTAMLSIVAGALVLQSLFIQSRSVAMGYLERQAASSELNAETWTMIAQLEASCVLATNVEKSYLKALNSSITPFWNTMSPYWNTLIICLYLNVLTKLHSRARQPHSSGFAYRFVIRVLGREPATFDSFSDIYENRERSIAKIKNTRIRAILKKAATVESAYFANKSTVSTDLPWLLFILIHCIVNLLYVVWIWTNVEFWDSQQIPPGMGFGQITPLVLLLVPVLTGIQAFQDIKTGVHTTTSESDGVAISCPRETGLRLTETSISEIRATEIPSAQDLETNIPPPAYQSRRESEIGVIPCSQPTLPSEERFAKSFEKSTPPTTCCQHVELGKDQPLKPPQHIPTTSHDLAMGNCRSITILDDPGFRTATVSVFAWNVFVIVGAVIICCGPCNNPVVNAVAIVGVCSLFFWEFILEFSHVLQCLGDSAYAGTRKLMRAISAILS